MPEILAFVKLRKVGCQLKVSLDYIGRALPWDPKNLCICPTPTLAVPNTHTHCWLSTASSTGNLPAQPPLDPHPLPPLSPDPAMTLLRLLSICQGPLCHQDPMKSGLD